MTTSLLERTATSDDRAAQATSTTTCQAYAGSLLAPCPNTATREVFRRGAERRVCPAHA